MQTLTNIVLDLHKPNYVRVTAKQYNDKSRIINVQVTDYGNLITLPEDMIARVKWHKPDGKGVFNDCDIRDNVIRVELTAEMLSSAGTAMAELILYQQDSVVSTMAFSVEIYKSVMQDKDIVSSDEFRALSNALISVDKCIRSCEENTEQLLEVQLSIEENRENMNELAEEINTKTSSDDFDTHTTDNNVHVTEEEKERWNTVFGDISDASVKYAESAGSSEYAETAGSSEYAENAGCSESCAGNAATATALTTNAGSATQPVYFSDGNPVACTSYANASVKYATSAGSAVDQTARNNANAALEKNTGLLTYSSNEIFTTFGVQHITRAGKIAFIHMHFKLNTLLNSGGLIATIPSGFRPYVNFDAVSPINVLNGSKGTIKIGMDGSIQSTSQFLAGDYALDFTYPIS